MSAERTVTIDLPEAGFRELIAGLDAPKTQNLQEAFSSAAENFARKQRRNFLVNYFDLASGSASAPVTAYTGAWLSLDKDKSVRITVPESEFKKIIEGITTEKSKNLSDAFSAAAADLDRKEARNFVVNYFDLGSRAGCAEIPAHKHATLSVTR